MIVYMAGALPAPIERFVERLRAKGEEFVGAVSDDGHLVMFLRVEGVGYCHVVYPMAPLLDATPHPDLSPTPEGTAQ